MGAAENRRLAEEAIDAMDNHDVDRLVSLYAEDAVRETVGMAVQRGHEEIKAFYHNAFTGIPDARVRALSVMADDDGACIEWEESGTSTGVSQMYDGSTSSGTGRTYTARVAVHDTIRNGKITVRRLFVNYLDVFGQLGLLPSQ
jgi:uncharacterized protein (TIGR02246 family)